MSSENQTKNVEIGNTPNENTAAEKPKSEWEQMLGRTGETLAVESRMNPQMQLMQLRKWCNQCLAKVNEPPKAEAATETENKVENQEGENG